MKWRLALGLVLVALLVPPGRIAIAGTFSDAFSTNPLTSRWCERFHNVHYNVANHWMVAWAASTCDSAGGCCLTCLFPCSTAPGNSSLLISKSDYTGTTRSAAIDVGWPTTLVQATGEHPAVFSVVHPNCHTGYEATIFAESGGTYQLIIVRPTDSTKPECDDFAATSSGAITGISLSLSSTPRYNLKLTTQPSGPLLYAFAQLKDNNTGQQKAVLGWYSDYPTSWYNNKAKRFGIGGIRLSTEANGFRLDNFVGTF